MSVKGVKIQLNSILVNKENFRHSPLNNEIEAIHYLITEDYESYLNLAKEIQKDCRTFTALMLEKNENRILMDANRRVSVLKIFENPTLIPEDKEYDDLRNLCIATGSLGIHEITADIYYDTSEDDKENLMNALNELHVKDNNTRKDWNALSQYRASQFIGSTIKHPWIQTLEYYGFTDEQIIEMTDQRTDIFSRIMRKQQLLILDNGKINLNNDIVVINEICNIVKNRAYYLNDKVQVVNTRTPQPIYVAVLDDLIKKYSIEQESFNFSEEEQVIINDVYKKKLPTTISEQIDFELSEQQDRITSTDKVSENTNPLRRDIENRVTIISVDQKRELSMTQNSQVNQIAHELSILNLNTFIISGPILLRSFLQYSFEWYASEQQITFNHSNLVATVKSVMNKMFEASLINREQKGTLKALLENAEIVNLLNEATHNFQSAVIPKTILIDFYNSLHPLIRNIYN